MIYSLSEINRISGSRLAVKNQYYTDVKGNKYKGTSNGRLEQVFTSDKTIGVKLNVDDRTEDLNTYLKTLSDEIHTFVTFDNFVKEFMDSFTYAQKQSYKVFNYTGDNITEILIYKDSTLRDLLYTVTFTYTGDNLTKKEIVKSDNSYTLTKNFTYDINNNITNIETL
jgi:hypothetical protein